MRKIITPVLIALILVGCTHSPGDTLTRTTDRATMVYIAAGEYVMGNDSWMDDVKPAHRVGLDAFWLDRTEVTADQYRRCVEARACATPGSSGEDWVYDRKYDNRPMTGVDWSQASAYCNWVGARLPTEAEWEYAARGPEERIYPWGNEWDENRVAIWYPSDPAIGSQNVGSHPDGASWCGALDLAGNVAEWVEDWYGPYTSNPQANPNGPLAGDVKVIRGGSFLVSNPGAVRSDQRNYAEPSTTSSLIGFRCASSP